MSQSSDRSMSRLSLSDSDAYVLLVLTVLSSCHFSLAFIYSSDSIAVLPHQMAPEDQLPTDISMIPEALAAEPGDAVPQSEVMKEITQASIDPSSFMEFDGMRVNDLKLSRLRTFYEKGDKTVLSLLSKRHAIVIDDEFRLKMGTGQIRMDTKTSMIDYHLTVANCVGFSPLLPNAQSHHLFEFKMDLK